MRSHGGGHRMMRFLRKSGIDERSAMLVVGVCAVTMAGLLMAVGEYFGRYFSKPLVEIVIFWGSCALVSRVQRETLEKSISSYIHNARAGSRCSVDCFLWISSSGFNRIQAFGQIFIV